MSRTTDALLVLVAIYLISKGAAAPKQGLGKLGPQSPKQR